MVDDKLERDELQRAANYEAIKSDVKADVGGQIAAEANVATPTEAHRVEQIAGDMRNRAVNEVEQTEREVQRGRFVARISQVVDYIFFLVYGLLVVRLLLALFAARGDAHFFVGIEQTHQAEYFQSARGRRGFFIFQARSGNR